MDDILTRIRSDLQASSDAHTRESGLRYFKEPIQLYGVKTARVSALARQYLKELNGSQKNAIFDLCDALWASGFMEESFIACHWAYTQRARFEPTDFTIFERWVSQHVSNWASCDTLCNLTIGAFIERFPAFTANLKSWTGSPNRWMRRAAAVSLIVPARKCLFIEEIFAIADSLLEDSDDLVRKGYGWLLKSASQAHQQAVFDFVMARKARMPRTALRYAIEKLPPGLRAQAMEKP